ncbi:hypothetical protein C8F04DRAFT_1248621 [Mycena alexandri]|uniref:Uncharacterized protein n=1 Tax=Mycena alexandri TaxID=1745969 RepID=A0AAD6XIK3_9AGAR|nr:hypothetical protein C8F04DRAFT_1248621 [Mycena alexandri]
MSDFDFHTTAQEVATAFAGEITGTSLSGLGLETARVIAKHPSLVIAGHNEERLKLSEKALREKIPPASIRLLIFDVSSFSDVRKAAAETNGEPSSARVKWKTIEEGASIITVAAAFDPNFNDKFGVYLTDCKDITSTIASHASDPAPTEKLWNLTEEVVGETFTFSRL